MIEIRYADPILIPSFHACLDQVARERIFIEMTEAPPLERVAQFQSELIAKKGPVFYAVTGQRVVGWCDVFPESGPRLCHRGHLGMGLLPEFRGQGIGGRLLSATLEQARVFGCEKVELCVYTSNTPAIALYRRAGFVEEGLTQRYRKLDGRYFDALRMAKFLASDG